MNLNKASLGLLELACVEVVILDLEGSFIYVNEVAAANLRYSQEELLRMKIWQTDPNYPTDQVDESIAYLRSNKSVFVESLHVRKDGSSYPVSVTSSLIKAEDQELLLSFSTDISEQKSLQAALLHQQQFTSDVLNAITDGISVLDRDLNVLMVNRRMETLFQGQELVGRKCHQVYQSLDEICPFCPTIKSFETGEIHRAIVPYPNPDHPVGWMELSIYPIKNEQGEVVRAIEYVKDITQEVKAKNALIDQKAFFRTIIQTIPDLVWIKDPEGVYLGCNPRFEQLYDVSEAQIIGKADYDFVDADLADFFRAHDLNAMRHNGPIINEEWLTFAANGYKGYFETTKTPMVDAQGALIGVLGVARDITARKLRDSLAQLRNHLIDKIYAQEDKYVLLRSVLDQAETWTQSQIAFFHLVDEDQGGVSLQTWSTNTLEKMCFAEGNSAHYPISQAGVWVECIHRRKSMIYNDYASLSYKKGLPQGHAPLSRFVSVPLFRNQKIVAIMGVGNKPTDYVPQDVAAIEQYCEAAFDIVERHDLHARLQHMAFYDLLTELPNRALIIDRLEQACAMSRRNHNLVALCYLDLDGFKPINDRYGHHIGDALLKELALRLNKSLRAGDTVARLGGDEFVLVFTELKKSSEVQKLIKRTLESITAVFDIAGHRIHISASIGATIFPSDNSDPEMLIRHADQAMYQAKEAGKSRYVLYEPVATIQNGEMQKRRTAFAYAMENDELLLHYQPKISLADGRIIGFEALIRWNHPQSGLLLPGAFLPTIEETSQELLLGEWVAASALKQLEMWDKAGYDFSLSINISPRQIQQSSFAYYLESLAATYKRPLFERLELEILEIAAIDDSTAANEVMNRIRSLGIKFSLDDFGTGYSSVAQLHRLPIDILQIDQNFVKEIFSRKENLDIVEGVLVLASSLHKPVIAEGVESQEIGLLLLQLGCSYAQGFGIARPMPIEALFAWVDAWSDNPWARLHRELPQMEQHYGINIAIFSHQRWFEAVMGYLLRDEALVPIDEQQCTFERWYLGIGRSMYGKQERYPFLQAYHHRVHELASALVQQRLDGLSIDHEALLAFENAKESLVQLLRDMKKEL
ncbi:MAG: EAL domain-containing protein [Campylobacterales bacterium]|nr:EAL domain-containing protein [Campylobacterales bacterium]